MKLDTISTLILVGTFILTDIGAIVILLVSVLHGSIDKFGIMGPIMILNPVIFASTFIIIDIYKDWRAEQ